MRPLFSLSPSPSPLIALDTARVRSCGLGYLWVGEMRSASDPIVGASVGPTALPLSSGPAPESPWAGPEMLSCG